MNDVQIDIVLDELAAGRLSEQEATSMLAGMGIADATDTIRQHRAAVQLVEQYGTLQSIKRVRLQYEATAGKAAPVASTGRVVSIVARRVMQAAAAILLLAGAWGLYSVGSYSTGQMLADMQTGYSLNTSRAGAAQPEDELVAAFRAGNYAATVAAYRQMTTASSREMFLAGYAMMQLKDYKQAAVTFEKLLQQNQQSGEPLYSDDGEYYLAQCYLQLQQPAKAFPIMQRIYNNEQHTYHEKISTRQLIKVWWLQ